MVERETAAETAEFVNAMVDAVREEGISRVLISTRKSRPVFMVEEWKLSEALERQRGLEFRAFGAEETAAIAWLHHNA